MIKSRYIYFKQIMRFFLKKNYLKKEVILFGLKQEKITTNGE